MSQHNITVQAGSSVRLLTAGKYCDRDIVVSAEGGAAQVEENQLHGTLDGTLETIDSDVTQVIEYACRSITALTTVNLPEATSLGVYAFYDCGNLTTFYGPKVAKLGTYTFYRCSKLKEVSFPLTSSVPVSCFYRCTSLTKADLGAATVIDSSAFAYCTALETVILRKTDAVVTLNSSGFSNANFDGYVYVPTALVESYKTETNWSVHASRIRAIEDYPDICGA